MVSIVLGFVLIALGLWGVIHWCSDFVVVLRGFGPISVLLGGVIAVITGFASFRSNRPNENKKK